jgi:hypothetical protein
LASRFKACALQGRKQFPARLFLHSTASGMKKDYRTESPEFRVRADALSEKITIWALISTILFLAVVIAKEVYWRNDHYADGASQPSPNDKRLDHYSTQNPHDPYTSEPANKEPYADSNTPARQRPL